MNETIILAVISAVVFFISPIILKSNAIYMFLLLAVSELTSNVVSKETTKFLNSFIPSTTIPLYSVVQIAILLLPPLFILFVYRKSIKPKYLILNIICAASATVVFFNLVVSKLPYDNKTVIENANLFNTLSTFLDVALVAGLLASIIYIFLKKPKHDKKDKKHK